MSTSIRNGTNVVIVAFATLLGTAGLVSADPGKGLRWSDHAFGPSRTQVSRPVTQYYYPTVPTTSGVVTAPAATTGQTITIRGADGVVRTFPVQGGVVQQMPTQSTVMVQGADGVIRSSPVTTGGTPGATVIIVPCPDR